jgi:hypothetical protein
MSRRLPRYAVVVALLIAAAVCVIPGAADAQRAARHVTHRTARATSGASYLGVDGNTYLAIGSAIETGSFSGRSVASVLLPQSDYTAGDKAAIAADLNAARAEMLQNLNSYNGGASLGSDAYVTPFRLHNPFMLQPKPVTPYKVDVLIGGATTGTAWQSLHLLPNWKAGPSPSVLTEAYWVWDGAFLQYPAGFYLGGDNGDLGCGFTYKPKTGFDNACTALAQSQPGSPLTICRPTCGDFYYYYAPFSGVWQDGGVDENLDPAPAVQVRVNKWPTQGTGDAAGLDPQLSDLTLSFIQCVLYGTYPHCAPKPKLPPVNQTPPSLPQAVVGTTLNADPGTWTGTEPISYSYRWMFCDAHGLACIDDPYIEGQQYSPFDGEAGLTLQVEVTATNPYGSATARSAGTFVYPLAPGSDAEQYRPYLFFDSAELWRPLNVNALQMEPLEGANHQLCDNDLGCSPLPPPDRLNNPWLGKDYLNLDDSKKSPFVTGAPFGIDDTDAPGDSLIYEQTYDETTSDEFGGQGQLRFFDYWVYYRYNNTPDTPNNVPSITDANHESDWEGVTVAVNRTTGRVFGVFFANHGHGSSHFASELHFDPSGMHVSAYPANGSHATYWDQCTLPICYQPDPVHVLGEDVYLPEGRSDGGAAWSQNDACTGCVAPFPNQSWAWWGGLWGDDTLACVIAGTVKDLCTPPISPNDQPRTVFGVLLQNVPSANPFRRVRAGTRADATDDPCATWMDFHIAATSCDPTLMQFAAADAANGIPAQVKLAVLGRDGASDGNGGASQLVGDPLQDGDSIVVLGTAQPTDEVSVQVADPTNPDGPPNVIKITGLSVDPGDYDLITLDSSNPDGYKVKKGKVKKNCDLPPQANANATKRCFGD